MNEVRNDRGGLAVAIGHPLCGYFPRGVFADRFLGFLYQLEVGEVEEGLSLGRRQPDGFGPSARAR